MATEPKIQTDALPIARDRWARRAYGFDEVALVPGSLTLDPELVDLSWELDGRRFPLPLLASAMDAVVDIRSAAALGRLGAAGVLNLQGVQGRYREPERAIEEIISATQDEVIQVIQRAYSQPLNDRLVVDRVSELRATGAPVAVSATPAMAEHLAQVIGPAMVDVFVIQSTVTTVRHLSERYQPPDLAAICQFIQAPVIVGNCVSFQGALELMQAGVHGVLVGVGPGAACTTRRVLGIGVPQVTAIADAAAARDAYFQESGRRVAVIADGGMRVGGDLAKAIAAGADAVMIGSPLAAAAEAPGRGFHWGMATADSDLPRGTRIKVGTLGTLHEILLGPAHRDDGTLNLMGALRLSMASCGARNLRAMQQVEMVIAPALPSEGKVHQRQQGMGGAG